MRASTKFLLCSASALSLVGVDVRRANACGPPSCDPVVVAPANGSTVPANLPGFPVLDERHNVSLPADAGVPATAVELVNASGETIALERRELPKVGLMVPKQSLVPGTYELRFKSRCDLATFGPRRGPNVVQRFTVGPAQPLPTSTGRVTTSNSVVSKYTVPSGGGGCSTQATVAMIRVHFEPSPALVPFLPLAHLTMKVDGWAWGEFTWGGGHLHPNNGYIMPPREPLEIVAPCENGRLTSDWNEGEHKGELSIELAGAPALPPIPFTFRFDCKAPAAAPSPPGTGGGSTAVEPGVDAGDAPLAPDGRGVAGEQQTNGCSLGGRPASGAFSPLLVGLSLGALCVARRRRR